MRIVVLIDDPQVVHRILEQLRHWALLLAQRSRPSQRTHEAGDFTNRVVAGVSQAASCGPHAIQRLPSLAQGRQPGVKGRLASCGRLLYSSRKC